MPTTWLGLFYVQGSTNAADARSGGAARQSLAFPSSRQLLLHRSTFRHPWRSPGGQTPEFQSAVGQLVKLADEACTVIMCAEKQPAYCHRSLVADYLSLRAIQVRHLVDPDETLDHRLSRLARCEGEHLIYDGLLQRKLELS
jgi:hypothetical protein